MLEQDRDQLRISLHRKITIVAVRVIILKTMITQHSLTENSHSSNAINCKGSHNNDNTR